MLERLVLRWIHTPLFRLVLDQPLALVGRSTSCDLVVSDESVSRKHAQIRTGEQTSPSPTWPAATEHSSTTSALTLARSAC
jgi:hypothetical protein